MIFMNENEHIFFSDLKFPGQYYGVLVRAERTGKLLDIPAPDMPEGYFFYTAADVPGKNTVEIHGDTFPVFAGDKIAYAGEPAGILVGPDFETAEALAGQIEIRTEEPETADNAGNEPWFAVRTGQEGDCTAFFSEEAEKPQETAAGETQPEAGKKTADGTDKTEPETDVPPDADGTEEEPLRITTSAADILPGDYFHAEHSGVCIRWKKEQMEIHTATHWPFHVRETVAAVLACRPEEIAVLQTDPGEIQDVKIWKPSLLAAQAAVASFLCKKSVKLVFSRREEFLYTAKSPAVHVRIKTAANADGVIKAISTHIDIHAGSYVPFTEETIARMILAPQMLYRIENRETTVRIRKTALPPLSPLNEFGESNAFLALETHMDILARELHLLPTELKFRNQADEKYTAVTERVCAVSGFLRKYTAYESLNKKRRDIRDGPVRGIGLSWGHQHGIFVSPSMLEGSQYTVEVTMETSGEVHIKSVFYSPTMKEILCDLAAETLDIDKKQIRFSAPETSADFSSGPDILSSKVAILAPLVAKCCASIQRQRFRKPLPITVKKSWKPAKALPSGKTGTAASMPAVTPGACVVELELNPLDYRIKTKGVWLACSAGKLFDRHAAETTLKKNLSDSAGRLFAGAVQTDGGVFSMRDGALPDEVFSGFLPDPEICFVESKDIPSGLGSLAYNLLPGAYCAALSQLTGNAPVQLPLDAKNIYACLVKSAETGAES